MGNFYSKNGKKTFNFSVGYLYSVLPYLSGIDLDEVYLNPQSCVRAFHVGRKRAKELFGDDATLPAVSCPPISYGHVICLGAKVTFPHNSEPAVRPVYQSIDEGIESLKEGVSFEENDLFKHYLATYHYLKREFPEENVKFNGFGWEGPITSAVLLRGTNFFVDLYREPQKVKKFLELLTDNIVKFVYLTRRINLEPEVSSVSAGLADDISSYIHPNMWREFVLPYWNQYYAKLTTSKRSLHCENLSPDHLTYLEEADIYSYDPSISKDLSVRIIREKTNIFFSWRLPSFELLQMSAEEVRKWVRKAAEDGAPQVHLSIEPPMCEGDNPSKVLAFIEAAKKIKAQLEL